MALFPALFVHLAVNRIVAAVIVGYREQRTFFSQLQLSLRELHWGYINIYLSVLSVSLLKADDLVIGILLTAAIQMGYFWLFHITVNWNCCKNSSGWTG